MIPTPLIQYISHVLISQIYVKIHIYNLPIFSEYKCREDPTREKIPKLFPLHSTTSYRPGNHSFKNNDNDFDDFQS